MLWFFAFGKSQASGIPEERRVQALRHVVKSACVATIASEKTRAVKISLDRDRSLTLLFDPEHALDERIAMEQFAT